MAIVDETGVAIRADFTKFDGDVTAGAKSASRTFAREFNPGQARDTAGKFLPSGADGATSGKATGKGFTSSLGSSLKGGIGSLHDTVRRAVLGLAAGAAAVFTVEGVTEFLHASDERAVQANKLAAITTQTIKGTGGAAHVTAGQIDELAEATARKTGVDAEQIHASENVLLTFTKVRNEAGKGNDIFNKATGLVNDLAVATGRGARPAALALGKALQDPVKQVTALTRIGVVFTKGQKDQIAAMVKNGNTVGAQKLILQQLSDRYGGVAAAAATSSGKFHVAIQSIQDTIGKVLVPVVNFAAAGLTTLVDGLNSPGFAAFGHTITGALTQVVAAVRLFVGSFTGAGSDAGDTLQRKFVDPVINLGATARDIFDGVIVPAFHAVVSVIKDDIIPAVENLVGVFAPLAQQIAGAVLPILITVFQRLASILVNQIGPAFLAITGFLKDHAVAVRAVAVALLAGLAAYKAIAVAKTIITAITSVTKIWAAAQAALNAIMDANPITLIVIGLAALAAGLIYAYKNSQTFRNIVQAALGGVETAFHAVIGAGEATVNALVGAFHAVTGAVSATVDFIRSHWVLLVGILLGPLGVIVALVITHFGQIKSVISGAIGSVIGFFRRLASLPGTVAGYFGEILDGVKKKMGDVVTYLAGEPARILKGLGDIASDFEQLGKDIVAGIVAGIVKTAADIGKAVAHAIVGEGSAADTKNALAHGRAAAGVRSPSKVFADKLGRPIGLGVAAGIDGAAPSITDSLIAATSGNFRGGRPTLRSFGAGIGATGASGGGAGGPALVIQDYHEAPTSNPYRTAADLALIARSRGGSITR